MKTNRLSTWLQWLLLPTLVAGCLGQMARQHSLAPAIKAGGAQAALYAVQSPGMDPAKVAKFGQALTDGDAVTIKALWSEVYAAALDAIARRTDVSEGVKDSLREPLKQTDTAVGRLR